MANLDAATSGQIFRKDNPIILACRRDQAVFIGVRLLYDGNDYQPGQCLVRVTSTGIFQRWSTASGLAYDSPCVLFDQSPAWQMLAAGQEFGATGGVSGTSLERGIIKGLVYTNNLTDFDANFATQLKSKSVFDSNAVGITSF